MDPPLNTYSFSMRGKRAFRYILDLPEPPPKEHIRRSPITHKIKYELFGLKDYTPYTSHWFIAVEQPAVIDLIKKHEKFLKGLTFREVDILRVYTFFGDKFLNRFLRQAEGDIPELISYLLYNDVETPLDYQIYDNYDELKARGLKFDVSKEELIDEDGNLIRRLCKDIFVNNLEWFSTFKNIKPMIYSLFVEFMDIMLRAPRTTEPITVYRGVVSEHQKSLTFTSVDFWSTSIKPTHTLEFTKEDEFRTSCCVYEITVNPNIPCLFLAPISKVPNDIEILLPPSVLYRSGTTIQKKFVYPPISYGISPSVYVISMEAVSFSTDSLSYSLLEKRWEEERARRLKQSHRRLKYTINATHNPKLTRSHARRTSEKKHTHLYNYNKPASYARTERNRTRKASHHQTAAAAGGAGARASSNSVNRYVPLLEAVMKNEPKQKKY